MLNVNYLLEIKIETKNSATTVGIEPETLVVPGQYIARCTLQLTMQLIYYNKYRRIIGLLSVNRQFLITCFSSICDVEIVSHNYAV